MQWTPEEKGYIWLDSFPLSVREKKKLLTEAGNSVNLVKNFSKFRQILIDFRKESVYNTMQSTLTDGGEYFRKLSSNLQKSGIIPLCACVSDYPEPLRSLSDSPLVIYAKGNLALLKERKFAIVGSRRISPDAYRKGVELSENLSDAFAILSGFADGGDCAAIDGAMKKSKIICVLASGFSALPRNKAPLFEKITERGLLLSPYPMHITTREFSYGYRNKILATLSEGALVLSAGEKSGALITADYIKKAKKPLFALPYSLGVASGAGCNALIKDGAFLAQSAEDIFTRFGIRVERKNFERSFPKLNSEESQIIAFLRERTEAHVSEIAEKTEIPAFKLTAMLSLLEIKGMVVKLGGNRYAPV